MSSDNEWALTPEAFVEIFKGFGSIFWTEDEMRDCFSLVDEKEDGIIGRRH